MLKKLAWMMLALWVVCTLGFAKEAKTWKINLKDADIRALITQVSDITGRSFIVDPRVKGKITVISTDPMSESQVYELLQAVLEVHGFAAVPQGKIIKITPDTNAKQDGIPLNQSKNIGGGALVTRVISIKNTPAEELVPLLRPMIAQYGHIAAVPSANALIISDRAENIKRMMEIINRVDSSESEELEVIQLKNAGVGDVVGLLGNLEPVNTGQSKSSEGSSGSVARVTVVAEERTNRLIMKGEKSARARVRALVKELDQPTTHTGSTQVIYLRHAKASKVAELLKALLADGQRNSNSSAQAKAPTESVNIQADETLNALVIRAEPGDMRDIQDIVTKLDIRRAQVLIEAAIVEISGDIGSALGIQWASLNGTGGAQGGISFSNLGNSLNGVIAAVQGLPTAAGLADGITLAAGKQSSNGKGGYGALLQALATASNANLLSTPSIMTLDNEEAKIVVGQNVPFITGTSTGASNGVNNPFQTISREDVGLTLKVIPQISDGDVVRLQVEQEVSSVVPTSSAVQSADLITNKRSIKTTILADNGETIVLGGLIEDDVTDAESRVPLLGDIPLLGHLFRSTKKTHVKRNLLVFLQPNIIRDSAAVSYQSNLKYDRLKSIQLETNKKGGLFRSRTEIRLPEKAQDLYQGKMPLSK